MAVHAAPVVTVERLRHEGSALALSLRYVAYCVLEELEVVGGADQCGITEINFTLPGRSDFVVMTLNMNPYFLQFRGNLAAKILQCIEGWQRYVTLFVSNVISEISVTILPIGIPDGFGAVQCEPR